LRIMTKLNANARRRRRLTTAILLAFSGAIMLIFSLCQQGERNYVLVTTMSLLVEESSALNAKATTKATATTTDNNTTTTIPKLEFVHITKTGGSAIEKAAATQAGIAWGACHYHHGLFQSMGCPFPPDLEHAVKLTANHPFSSSSISRWHIPLQYLEPHPFSSSKTFAVVRNPYDRAVSLYYCPWAGYQGADRDTNIAGFNQWIQNQVKRQEGILMTPQSLYIWDATPHKNDNESRRQIKMVDHVLHYESLSQDFQQLMQDYHLNITLPQEKYNHNNHNKNNERLTRRDLTRETVALINEVYRDDFENFGYETERGCAPPVHYSTVQLVPWIYKKRKSKPDHQPPFSKDMN